MAGKRKRYSAAFKAKVALEAIRGELTMAQLVTKHGVHQTLISAWKRQAVDGLAGVFSAKAEVAEAVREGELEKLHATIGQLVVERDFLRKASGPIAAADERRSEARDDRAAAPEAGDCRAVQTHRHQSVGLLRAFEGRKPAEPVADAVANDRLWGNNFSTRRGTVVGRWRGICAGWAMSSGASACVG